MLVLAESLSFLDSPDIDWKSITITALIGKYVFECYIGYRQYQVLLSRSSQTIPDEFNIEVVQKFDESQAKIRFGFCRSTMNLVIEIFLIKFNILAKLWATAGSVNHFLSNASFVGGFIGESATTQSVFFFAIFSAISAFEELPWSFYQSLFLSGRPRHLIVRTWLILQGFKYVGQMVIRCPVIYMLCRLVDHFGTSFAPYMCAFLFVFEAFVVPFTGRFVLFILSNIGSLPESELPDGELKTEIETVTKKLDIPLVGISTDDSSSGSSFTVHFIGFPWKRKAVINGALIEKYTAQEMVSVFVRDACSLKQNTKWKNALIRQVRYLLVYAIFSKFLGNASFARSFGFTEIHSAYLVYFLFSFMYAPVRFANQFIVHAVSRRLVYNADAFVKEHGYAADYAAYLRKSNPKHSTCDIPDWLFAVFHMPSPSVAERLKALGITGDEKNEEKVDNKREQ